MEVAVSFDGDHVGRLVGRLSLADDAEGIRRIGQAIDAGNKLWASWAEKSGGSVIEVGGDEGRVVVPAEALAELPAIREQYAGAVGSTVSVGVGKRLSEADKALLAAKLRGGDRITFYAPDVEEEVEKARQQGRSEADKLSEEYLGKGEGEEGGQKVSRHGLPGQLEAEGYRLDVEAGPGGLRGLVHRGHQPVGEVLLGRRGGVEESWEGGRSPRGGLRDAVLRVLAEEARGVHEPDGWEEADYASGAPLRKDLRSSSPGSQVPGPATPGAGVTPPHPTYEHGVKSGSSTSKNVWVRQSAAPSNSGRTLMVQFSSPLLQKGPKTRADDYYDKLYASREGYHRPADFWEIPQWQAHVARSFPDADSYVVRDPGEAARFFDQAGYKNLAFSALDVNKDLVREIAQHYKGRIAVGGYTDMSAFSGLPNVTTYPTVKAFAEAEGKEYQPGYDYRHFSGTKTIPRLTLSQGCRHHCSFCSVSRTLEETPRDAVMQQVDSLAEHSPAELVYLNDKTFGQAPNHQVLPEVYARFKAKNPDFKGFIVQTTAAQVRRLDPEFLKRSGVKYVELGVESYNDPVLRSQRKPASEQLIDEAVAKLRGAGIRVIPNIMVGLPGEDASTYRRTMDWLERNRDAISHVNTYNLALYDDTELGKKLKVLSDKDRDENVVGKSFHQDPKTHQDFHDALFRFADSALDRQPVQKSLRKAQPAMNPGAGAGFSGPSRPGAPQPATSPKAEASEHTPAEAARAVFEQSHPPAPEQTHAARSLEDQFHDHADRQDAADREVEGRVDSLEERQKLRGEVAKILASLKEQAPVLQQLARQAPAAYAAVAGLVQATPAMGAALSGQQGAGPGEGQEEVRKSEPKISAGKGRYPTRVSDLDVYQYVADTHLGSRADLNKVPQDSDFQLVRYPVASLPSNVRLDNPRAQEYAKKPTPLPPIVVGYGGSVPDGHFRIAAARLRGEATLLAYVPKDEVPRLRDVLAPYNPKLKKGEEVAGESEVRAALSGDNLGVALVLLKKAEEKGGEEAARRLADLLARRGAVKTEPDPGKPPVEGAELAKAKLPMPGAAAHHHLVLPVGTTIPGKGKFKVRHVDGSSSWKQGRAGVILSQDPAIHPTSIREPGAR